MKPQIIHTETVLRKDNIAFVKHTIRLADGSILEKPVVNHPGAVAMLPLLPDGRVVLIRQYRLSLDRYILEIPAGTREPDEDPRLCAERELQEEAGYFPGKLTDLGGMYPAPGLTGEFMFLYLAEDLRPATLPADADELIEVLPMPLHEALDHIDSGEIQDAKTIIALWRLVRLRAKLVTD